VKTSKKLAIVPIVTLDIATIVAFVVLNVDLGFVKLVNIHNHVK